MHDEAPARPLPARTEFMTGEAALRGVRCAEAAYPPGLRLPLHVHAKPSITIVAAGALQERLGRGGGVAQCAEGAVVLRPAGEPHGNLIGPAGATHLELELDPALLDHHSVRIGRPEVRRDGRVARTARRLRRALRSEGARPTLLVEGLALELLAEVFRVPRGPRGRAPAPWLDRVRERIDAEFRSALTVEALAREAGVHPVHLARAFRRCFGASPGELVRSRRVAWAAEQLAGSDRPIGGIALDAGFCDQSHLSRAFRDALGVTPGTFRRRRAAR